MTGRLSPTALIEILQKIHRETGKVPTSTQFERMKGMPCDRKMFTYIFGSWQNALQIAGMKPKPNAKFPSRIEHLECLRCKKKFDFETVGEVKDAVKLCSPECLRLFFDKKKADRKVSKYVKLTTPEKIEEFMVEYWEAIEEREEQEPPLKPKRNIVIDHSGEEDVKGFRICNGFFHRGMRVPEKEFNRSICERCYSKELHIQKTELITSFKEAQGTCAFPGCEESDPIFLNFAHDDREEKSFCLTRCSIPQMREEVKKGKFLCIWHERLETKNENLEIFDKRAEEAHKYSEEEEKELIDEKNSRTCSGLLCKGKRRNLDRFYYQSSTGGYSHICKKCASLKSRKAVSALHDYKVRIKVRIGECRGCQRKVTAEAACCFDFDHIIPSEKAYNVSQMCSSKLSIPSINEEIKKCRLLCVFCHVLQTHKQYKSGKRGGS